MAKKDPLIYAGLALPAGGGGDGEGSPALKAQVNKNSSDISSLKNAMTEYAAEVANTTAALDDKADKSDIPTDYLKESDLSDYAKKSEITGYDDTDIKADIAALENDKADKTDIPTDYLKESDLSDYAKKSDLADAYDDTEIKAELAKKQDALTAGANITITKDDDTGETVISSDAGADGYDDTEIKEELAKKQDALTEGDGITIREVDGKTTISAKLEDGVSYSLTHDKAFDTLKLTVDGETDEMSIAPDHLSAGQKTEVETLIDEAVEAFEHRDYVKVTELPAVEDAKEDTEYYIISADGKSATVYWFINGEYVSLGSTSDINLTGYATEQWVESKGYQTASDVNTAISGKADATQLDSYAKNSTLNRLTGDLDDLKTTDNQNLVAAVNEVENEVNSIMDGSADIDLNITDAEVVSAFESVAGTSIHPSYSTEEQFTGKYWIDGKKIYSKTIDCGALPVGAYGNFAQTLTPHNVTNLDTVVKIQAFGKRSTGTPATHILNLAEVESSGRVFYTVVAIVGDNVRITSNTDLSAFNAYVTIEYTKA